MGKINFLVAGSLFLLSACGGGGGDPPPPPPPPSDSVAATTMTATNWWFHHSLNMPDNPTQVFNDTWEFEFPNQNGVHYLVHYVSGKIEGSAMSVTVKVERTGQLREVEPCPSNPEKAMVRLYFQRRGDDLSAAKPHYRWWSTATVSLNEVGTSFEFKVPMEPSAWSSVFGARGDTVPDDWAAAAADVQAVGMTFGGCFAGHGVYVSDGSAKFTASNFTIR